MTVLHNRIGQIWRRSKVAFDPFLIVDLNDSAAGLWHSVIFLYYGRPSVVFESHIGDWECYEHFERIT